MAKVRLELDDYDLPAFSRLAASFGQDSFAYVVTPNADHMIRFHDDASFRDLYAGASFVLLDSRFMAYLFSLVKRVRAKVCTGSDLTTELFNNVIRPDDEIVLIGTTDAQARRLRERYKLTRLNHYNPPMGFARIPAEVQKCLAYVEAHSPARFIFIAVGCPQQELVAKRLKEGGKARGLALCVGAAVNFLTGEETRAPRWMQQAGCEWLYRLLQDPRRLAKRYLVRGPRIFGLLGQISIAVRLRDANPVRRPS